jgi:fructokinase
MFWRSALGFIAFKSASRWRSYERGLSKIGTDNYGKGLVDLLADNKITTDFLQVDYDHPTGLVYANPNEYNEVVYDIVFPSAWDFIQQQDEYMAIAEQSEFFVYGSLTSRSKVSRDTLYQLLAAAKTPGAC